MDTLFKITAVLGALAWMPQIIKWIVSWLRKPKLNIICDNEAQVRSKCEFIIHFKA